MILFCKVFYIHLSIILSCLCLGMSQDHGTDTPAVNATAKEELMGRTILSTWPKHGQGLHLLPPKHGISVGAGTFGARARQASTNSPIAENQPTAAANIPSWILLNNQEQPIKLEEDLASSDNESMKRFARQNPGLIQDLLTQFQRTNEQLAQHWAPTLDTLQQQAPILYQMPLLGQALGQSILGSADSILDLFSRSADETETEKGEIRAPPNIIQQQDEAVIRKHSEKESSPNILQALFGSTLFQELQRLAENPSQLTNPFHLNPLLSRSNKNYMEAAPSDISEVRVQPNNIVKRTLAFKKTDKHINDLKKVLPQWFNMPKWSTKASIKTFSNDNGDMLTFSNGNETQKKFVTLERQLVAELKQLQSIVKLANDMKLQTGSNDESTVLHKIPLHKITIEDIENAIKDPDVVNILNVMGQYQKTMPHKRETSVNVKDNVANMLNHAAPLYNYYIPEDKNVPNSNKPISSMELKKHITGSEHIRSRAQTPVLQCHLSDPQLPDISNTIGQTPNANPPNSGNNNEHKIYYSNIKLPWFNALVNNQNTLKDYPTYPLYRMDQSNTKMSIFELLNNSEFKNWLLAEARYILSNPGLHNTTSSPANNETKSTEPIKEETMRGTTANIINQVSPELSAMQTDKPFSTLGEIHINNDAKFNSSSNKPIEMRFATPQISQNVDKQKGNLFGIFPHTFTPNILSQHNNLDRNRQENAKDSMEQHSSIEPKLRTFHTQPPTVINYYYNVPNIPNIPNKHVSSQQISADDVLKFQHNFNPTNNYPTLYHTNPLINNNDKYAEIYLDQYSALKQNHDPSTTSAISTATGLHDSNSYGQNINNLKVAIGDEQILEMLRQHQTLPNSMLIQTMMSQRPQYSTDTPAATPSMKPIMTNLNAVHQPGEKSHKHSSVSSDNFNLQLLSKINPSLLSCQYLSSSSPTLPILLPLSSSLPTSTASLLYPSNSNAVTAKPYVQTKTIWPFYFGPINHFTSGSESLKPSNNSLNNNTRFKRQNTEPSLSRASSSTYSLPLSSSPLLSAHHHQNLTPIILKRLLQINRNFATKFPILYEFLMGHYSHDQLTDVDIKTTTSSKLNNNDNYAYRDIENDEEFYRFLQKILNNQNIWEFLIEDQQQEQQQQQRQRESYNRNEEYENINYNNREIISKEELRTFRQLNDNENLRNCLTKLIENETFWQKLDKELTKYKQQWKDFNVNDNKLSQEFLTS